jgi:hypothetical protein
VYITEVYLIQMNDTADGQIRETPVAELPSSKSVLETSSLSLSVQTLRFTWLDRYNILQGTGFCLVVDRIVSSASARKMWLFVSTREDVAYCA